MDKKYFNLNDKMEFEVTDVTFCDSNTLETLLGPIPALKIEIKSKKKSFINRIMERIKYAKFFKK